MICIGINEVHTPSVRLSRFATHVETGRPRKSFGSIHRAAAPVFKTMAFCYLLPRFAARNFSISDSMRIRVALEDSQ